MACFILPHTVLNTPVTHLPSERVVSLVSYIQKQDVICQHECVNEKQLMIEFRHKYKLTDPIWITSDTEPESYCSIMINHSSQLTLRDLSMLTAHGTYISKLADSTTEESLQFLFKLASSFRNVCVCKPDSVCALSSIKYVVASDFLDVPKDGVYEIPYYFKMVVDELNSTYGQIQLEHLRLHNSLGKI